MRTLRSNIWKLYAIRALRHFMLVMPVLIAFFQENGMTVQEVFVLQSVFGFCIFLLNIPLGYFADIFSRKSSMVVGGIISTLGFALYAVSFGFWGFLAAEILLGIGMCFVSGADTAMLQDTLLATDEGGTFKKLESHNTSFSLFSESIAAFIGGSIALVSLRLPLIIDVFTTALIIPLALTLIEPARRRLKRSQGIIEAFKVVWSHVWKGEWEIAFLIAYFGFVSASTLTMVWFSQFYMLEAGLPLEIFGTIWGSLLFMAAVLTWNADVIEKFLGRKKSLILLWLLPVTGYLLTGSIIATWGILFLVPFYVTRGILEPVVKDYMNRLISSEIRATVLSVKDVAVRLMFSIIGPVVGWISDAFSLQAALLMTGSFFLVSGGTVLILMGKRRML